MLNYNSHNCLNFDYVIRIKFEHNLKSAFNDTAYDMLKIHVFWDTYWEFNMFQGIDTVNEILL